MLQMIIIDLWGGPPLDYNFAGLHSPVPVTKISSSHTINSPTTPFKAMVNIGFIPSPKESVNGKSLSFSNQLLLFNMRQLRNKHTKIQKKRFGAYNVFNPFKGCCPRRLMDVNFRGGVAIEIMALEPGVKACVELRPATS